MHDPNAPDASSVGTSAAAPTLPFNAQTHFSWIRTRMSADRTLMAWSRTSIALIGFGFTIYQFFEKFGGPTDARPEASRNLGLSLVIMGTAGTLVALWQYWEIGRYLGGTEFEDNGSRPGVPRSHLTFVIAFLLALVGVVTTIWMLLRL